MRKRDEETVDQQVALGEAQEALAGALEEVAAEARALGKALGRKSARRGVDLTQFHALYRLVVSAEEGVDIAAHDLATAGGEDA